MTDTTTTPTAPRDADETRAGKSETEAMPHDAAPLWVWHAWLCHGANADGGGGEPCPDGCDEAADPERLRLYRAAD